VPLVTHRLCDVEAFTIGATGDVLISEVGAVLG